jgi:hypothetical protein
VTDADLQGKNAAFTNPKASAELIAQADRVLTF